MAMLFLPLLMAAGASGGLPEPCAVLVTPSGGMSASAVDQVRTAAESALAAHRVSEPSGAALAAVREIVAQHWQQGPHVGACDGRSCEVLLSRLREKGAASILEVAILPGVPNLKVVVHRPTSSGWRKNTFASASCALESPSGQECAQLTVSSAVLAIRGEAADPATAVEGGQSGRRPTLASPDSTGPPSSAALGVVVGTVIAAGGAVAFGAGIYVGVEADAQVTSALRSDVGVQRAYNLASDQYMRFAVPCLVAGALLAGVGGTLVGVSTWSLVDHESAAGGGAGAAGGGITATAKEWNR